MFAKKRPIANAKAERHECDGRTQKSAITAQLLLTSTCKWVGKLFLHVIGSVRTYMYNMCGHRMETQGKDDYEYEKQHVSQLEFGPSSIFFRHTYCDVLSGSVNLCSSYKLLNELYRIVSYTNNLGKVVLNTNGSGWTETAPANKLRLF